MYELVVIGGGPAGASAAITAARAGARVLLLERGRFPRHKVCGEFVSAESLELLTNLLGPECKCLSTALPIASARVFLGERLLRASLDPYAASIARFDLDEALWGAAIQAGVEARQQVAVQAIQGTGPFLVTTSAEDFKTRAIVNASGRWSNLGAPANLSSGERWLGLKGHFAESSPPDSVDLYFFDGGYCGVSAVSLENDDNADRVNACAVVRAGNATSLQEVLCLNRHLEERSRRWQLLTETFSTWPLVFRNPQPVEGNILRAGDAACFVDPFIGDGISLALRSGALAAEMLLPSLQQEFPLAAAAANYARIYQQRFAPVFHASSRIRRALRLPRWLREPALSLFEHVPGIMQRLVSVTR